MNVVILGFTCASNFFLTTFFSDFDFIKKSLKFTFFLIFIRIYGNECHWVHIRKSFWAGKCFFLLLLILSNNHFILLNPRLFFGSFGIASFVYIKSGYFIDRDEAIKVREKIRQKLEEEDK